MNKAISRAQDSATALGIKLEQALCMACDVHDEYLARTNLSAGELAYGRHEYALRADILIDLICQARARLGELDKLLKETQEEVPLA